MRVGLTQSEGRLAELEPMLRVRGFEVVRQPLIRTRTVLDANLEPLRDCPWWLVTSVSVVDALHNLGCSFSGHKLGAVGEATAQAIRHAGGTVHLTSAGASVGRLLEVFLALGEAGPVGLPQGSRALPDLSDGLQDAGYEVRPVVVYQTESAPWPQAISIPDITLIASPSALEGLSNAFARKTRFVALGATTAQALAARGWNCVVPKGVRPEEVLEAIQTVAQSAVAAGGNDAD